MTTAATRPKAYSYVRMSTDVQLKGDSLRRQLERSREYANSHGLALDEEFRLEDLGISAFKGANVTEGALGRFLTAVRGGTIAPSSYLLVESLDRLSRQEVLKSLSIFTEIVNAGITIVTLADGRIYTKEKTDFSELILSIAIMSRAHEESRTKSYRGAAAWANKRNGAAQHKMTALCPGWLKLSSDRKQFEVIPERASVVLSIFEDSANGIGSYSIARRLNDAKVTPFGRSVGWQTSYVSKLLASRAVLGEFQPHRIIDGKRTPEGAPTPDYFPQIIDETLFYRAQGARHNRRIGSSGRKGEKVSNLFSQLAKCAYCRGSMVYLNKGRGPKGGTYLVCDNSNRGLGCEKILWRYDHFEASFLTFVKEINIERLFANDGTAKKRMDVDSALQSISGRIKVLEAQRERAYALYIEGREAAEFVAKKLNELESELSELGLRRKETEAQLVELRSIDGLRSESEDEIKALISNLQTATGEQIFKVRSQLAARLRAIVQELSVASGGVRSIDEYDFEQGLSEGWLTPEHIGDLKESLATKPKQGGRYFMVKLRDGTARTVRPSLEDPFVFYDAAHYTRDGVTSFLRLGDDVLSSFTKFKVRD